MGEKVRADQETIDEVVERLDNDAANPSNMAQAMMILLLDDIRHELRKIALSVRNEI